MALVLAYLKDGQPVETRQFEEIKKWVTKPAGAYWLDLVSSSAEEVSWLEETFRFHPLTIEDLRGINPRPKLEDYPGCIFLVLHSAIIERQGLELVEVHVFVSESYIITSYIERLESHVSLGHGLAEKADWLRRGLDFCLYRLMDNVADGYLAVVDGISDELDSLEDSISSSFGLRTIDPIVSARRQLAILRRVVSSTREIASELSLRQHPFIRSETAVYFRDVHSLLVTISDMSETQRDIASNILDAHLSTISNRLNDVMKRLALVATIFLPISFVAGVGGMNFTMLPFSSPVFFVAIVASFVLIPLIMILWFRQEGWF